MTATAGPPAKIPLSIFAGYLGTDRTPILRALLEQTRDAAFLAGTLIINNDSSTAPMAVRVAGASEEIFADPATGCLCCTLSSAFPALLEKLLRARDNDRISQFDRIFVAAAEDADPVPMIAGVLSHPYLSLRFRVASIVTGVTGCQDGTREESLARQNQIATASILMVPTIDPAEPCTAQTRQREYLTALNPSAQRLGVVEALANPFCAFQDIAFERGTKPEALRRSLYVSGIRGRP